MPSTKAEETGIHLGSQCGKAAISHPHSECSYNASHNQAQIKGAFWMKSSQVCE